MVAETPRLLQPSRVPFRTDPRLGCLIAVEFVVGEFAGFKATPCFRRERFEVRGPVGIKLLGINPAEAVNVTQLGSLRLGENVGLSGNSIPGASFRAKFKASP